MPGGFYSLNLNWSIMYYNLYDFTTGKKCVVCSTMNVFKLYQTSSGVVRPTSLLSCLPQMIRGFVKGSQQCAVEFFQEFWRLLGEDAHHLQDRNLIPRQCSLQFLNSFFISHSSEVLCSEYNNVTNNSVTETVLPLPITKVHNSPKSTINMLILCSSVKASRHINLCLKDILR